MIMRCAMRGPVARTIFIRSSALARYSPSSRNTCRAGSASSRATMSAVCSVRCAGEVSTRSGIRPSSRSRPAMASAPEIPRRLRGRAKSSVAVSCQRASPWRISVSRLIDVGSSALRDEHPPVLLADLVGTYRLVGRRSQRLARAQAKTREVARADDLAILDFGAGERLTVVGALVLDRVQGCAAAQDDDGVAVELGLQRRGLADGVDRGHIGPARLHA